MNQPRDGYGSAITRFGAHIGTPLTWSAADRCILATIVILPFALWHDAFLRFFRHYPEMVLAAMGLVLSLVWDTRRRWLRASRLRVRP